MKQQKDGINRFKASSELLLLTFLLVFNNYSSTSICSITPVALLYKNHSK